MNLMLLCAGEGTRFRPHTLTLPKPEIPFLTVPMAAYSLNWAAEISPSKLIVNTYHLPARIHQLFHKLSHGFHDVQFSDEGSTLMGSGGGIKKAEALLGKEDFLVMNGDEVFLPSAHGQLREAYEQHLKSGAIATLIVMNYPGVGSKFGGVWADAIGKVLGFGKDIVPGAADAWHFIGPMFLNPRVFKYLPASKPSNILYDGLAAAIAAGESVRAHEVTGWWHETGNEADYLQATSVAIKILGAGDGDAARFLENILRRYQPKFDFYVEGNSFRLIASPDLKVPSGSEGYIILGHDASLVSGENKNAVLGDGVHAKQVVQNKFVV